MIYIYKFFFFFFQTFNTTVSTHVRKRIAEPDRVYDPVIYTLDILLWKIETN